MSPSPNTSSKKLASLLSLAPASTTTHATAPRRSASLSAKKRKPLPLRKNASPNSGRRLALQLPPSSFQFLFSNFSKQNESQDKENRYIYDSDSRSRFVILAKIEEDSDDREHQCSDEECL